MSCETSRAALTGAGIELDLAAGVADLDGLRGPAVDRDLALVEGEREQAFGPSSQEAVRDATRPRADRFAGALDRSASGLDRNAAPHPTESPRPAAIHPCVPKAMWPAENSPSAAVEAAPRPRANRPRASQEP